MASTSIWHSMLEVRNVDSAFEDSILPRPITDNSSQNGSSIPICRLVMIAVMAPR